MSRDRAWLYVIATVVLCAACDGVVTAMADDAHVIVQNGRAFHPTEASIARGQSLSFSNQDEFIHQIYVDSQAMTFDSAEQQPGQVVSVTFPTAGNFPVRCHIHPKMKLVVHVK